MYFIFPKVANLQLGISNKIRIKICANNSLVAEPILLLYFSRTELNATPFLFSTLFLDPASAYGGLIYIISFSGSFLIISLKRAGKFLFSLKTWYCSISLPSGSVRTFKKSN
jgi:hypothetical protein